MFKAELEPFETSPDHYYLKVNGRTVAAIVPIDFIKMLNALGKGVTPQAHQRVAEAVATYYNERRKT